MGVAQHAMTARASHKALPVPGSGLWWATASGRAGVLGLAFCCSSPAQPTTSRQQLAIIVISMSLPEGVCPCGVGDTANVRLFVEWWLQSLVALLRLPPKRMA